MVELNVAVRYVINNIMKFIKESGFTLIELIVVIGIISIMAIAVLAVLDPSSQIKKANDARRKADLSQIQKALETYYQDNGNYPAVGSGYKLTDKSGTIVNWGSSWSPYMNVIPKDSTLSHTYVYYSPDRQSYYLYANLERGIKDPQVCNGVLNCASVPAGVNCGGVVCNYGVSSVDVSP